jgi:ABC-2 type transport system ATP-binding protein
VQDLSFSAPRGGICGVLGPNGAGKSTTLRMIVGILRPTSGQVLIDGAPATRAALRRVGYLPEERGLYRGMSPLALVTFFARLKGMPAAAARRSAMEFLERQGLGAYARRKIKTLSKGMAQKVQIAAALAHAPDLVVLDEPFSGLDPVNQATVEELIRTVAAEGRTVLFSTHIMEHAERMCERIVLIAKGRKAFEGPVGEALGHARRTALLETDPGFDLAAALVPLGFAIDALPDRDGRPRWRAALDDAGAARRLLSAAVQAGAPLTLFEPERATLHDAFVRIVGADAGPPEPDHA